ncbi:ROK family protein [Streptomyces sp. NPDC051582]|uniref:ROK family protein n=1 Tax=Streptomyces sp. NPDC051582 TaxID=3155167 RepID=UPI003436D774
MKNVRGDASYLRRLNSVAVLRAFYEDGPFTISAVAAAAGVSRPTSEEAVADLVAQGWLAEAETEGPRQPGRPARRFKFRADAAFVAGVDIGAHKVLTLVADLSGAVIGTHQVAVTPKMSAVDRLAAARQSVRGALESCGAGLSDLLAIVIATPGVVSDDGTVLMTSVLPEWTGMALGAQARDSLRALTGDTPTAWISVENDMKLAALAEHWTGAAQGVDQVVYLHAGHRMGAAVVIEGRPHRGQHGAAGEIGSLPALDWVSSYAKLLSYDPPGDADQQVERLFIAAGSDTDERAAALVESFARDIANGLAALVLTIDPELVVLGGGISRAGHTLLDPVTRHLQPQCLFPVRTAVSTLGSEAAALGAVRTGLDRVERMLFTVEAPLADPLR